MYTPQKNDIIHLLICIIIIDIQKSLVPMIENI